MTLPLRPEVIADHAAKALRRELATFPKPGLVSFVDNGSHPDMDADCFLRSISAITAHFAHMAEAAAQGASLADLQKIGLAAEADMLTATQNRNTHRGAIFCLGLLSAAAAVRHQSPGLSLGEIVQDRWGGSIPQASDLSPDSDGIRMCQQFQQGGVRRESACGFPTIYEIGLPALRSSIHQGMEEACVQTFFALLERCEDTTLLKRGGAEGLEFARREARHFLEAGGVENLDWLESAKAIHRKFIERNLTAGGVADLLAATLFVEDIERHS